MSDNVQNVTLEILRSIQESVSTARRAMDHRFDGLEGRLDRIEEIIRKQRRDTAGMLVMMKGTAGEFSEEIAQITRRIEALEQRAGVR